LEDHMTATQRRTWIKRIVSLPAIAVFGKLNLFAKETPSAGGGNVGEGYESISRAVRILRLINTAENWHKSENGNYLNIPDLAKSEAISKLESNSKAEEMGIGATLISEIEFEAKEIAPGWHLEIALSKNGLAYTARLTRTKQDGFRSFATDQDGIIYEGNHAAGLSVSLSQSRATEVLEDSRALGTHPQVSRGRISRLAWSLAFAAFPAPTGGCFGPGYPPCSCGGQCATACSGGATNCFNCGCIGCVWCTSNSTY
jgi:hypothetical protein